MTDQNNDLPNGWIEVPLGEVVEILDHLRIPVNAKERGLRKGSYPYFGANGQAGTIDDFIFDGDYALLAEDGGFFNNPSKGVAYRVAGKFWVNNHAHILKPLYSMDTSFIVNYLNSIKWMPFVSGTTRLKLTQGSMRKVPFKLPPLAEQKKISTKIEDLQSRSSKAHKALEVIPSLLKKFRQSVLSSAFRGDLTADWRTQNPDVEPASKLLERIRKERRKHWEKAELAKMKAKNKTPKDDKWKNKYKEPEPVDTTDLPELPEGWCWAKTDELFSFVTSGSRGWAKYYSSEGDIFLRIGNQERKSINLDLSNIQYVQPPEGTEGTRTQVKKDDILISITADIGIISIVSGKLPQSYINQHIALARPVQIVEAKFLAWYLASIDGQKQLQNLKKGMTKAGLRLDDIRSVIVPLPSINEQKYIVSTIENKLESIEMTSNRLSYCSSQLKLLDQSILAKAFRGELVPQDPDDEPASQLLERIQQEKASLEAATKKRRKVRKKKTPRKGKAVKMAKKRTPCLKK